MDPAASPDRHSKHITIMEWNIRHGGSRDRLPGIIGSLCVANPDIVILTEFRRNACEAPLRNALLTLGYVHQFCSDIPEKTNGIFVAAKSDLQQETDPVAMHRLLPLYLPSFDLHLLGTHIPGAGDKWDKRECWDKVLDYAKRHREERVVIIGDFNTGLPEDAEGSPFALPEKMRELRSIGYADAWRVLHPNGQEYTWWSTAKNGFRLDYAYLSPSLTSHLLSASHCQEGRLSGFSDHASILITLS